MRYLFFANTPAQAHQYRNAVTRLDERGHDVLVLARDYGCTLALLDYHDVPYEVYGKCGTDQSSLARELPKHFYNIGTLARRYDPDLVFGKGSYAAPAGAVSRTPVVLVADSETVHLDHAISRPLADVLLTPHAFGKNLGRKHYQFYGFKELAYLHPDERERGGGVESGPGVRDEFGLASDERYAIVRFNAFGSHHDVGRSGFSPANRRELIADLADHATVLVSDEGDDLDLDDLPAQPFDLHPARLHDALDAADLLVADTQTMVTEAALLGTPAIRSNSFVGEDDMGNFQALERAGLVRNLESFATVREQATALLADPEATDRWEDRRDEYVADKVNLTRVLVEVAENHRTPEAAEGVTSRGSRANRAVSLDPTGILQSGGGR